MLNTIADSYAKGEGVERDVEEALIFFSSQLRLAFKMPRICSTKVEARTYDAGPGPGCATLASFLRTLHDSVDRPLLLRRFGSLVLGQHFTGALVESTPILTAQNLFIHLTLHVMQCITYREISLFR